MKRLFWLAVAASILLPAGLALSQSDEAARLYATIGKQQVLIEDLVQSRALLVQRLTAVLQVVQAHGDSVLIAKVEALNIQMAPNTAGQGGR
jgi:hypothetical protein|tara:strand:- start:75 stop:350 length:276 start_codon:yes stop_codon:yes gene_type:complete